MNILHIAAHLGDGAGKAIGGLAILGSASGENKHRILLLEKPKKLNHVERCQNAGVQVLSRDMIDEAVSWADVVILNWWGSPVMDEFLLNYSGIPCPLILWSHKNGFFDPPLSQKLVDSCNYLLATSPLTFENPEWRKNSELVYGFGDFMPENTPHKTDYSLKGDVFTIGYTGTPSYKKLPPDFLDYCAEVICRIPNCKFVMAGEVSEGLKADIKSRGMSKYFDLAGWVSDVPGLLKSFDSFGYLLRYDTFATTENAVLEAMASAVPIVMSKIPLGKYILPEDNSAGILIDSPEEYGQAMRLLYESEDLRKRLGETGREHAVKTYRADENLRRLNSVCEMLKLRKTI